MKKACVLILLLTLFTGCSSTFLTPQVFTGSGVAASETRDVSGFSAVEVAGSANVTVRFGDSESVIVETDDNIQPVIETKVIFGWLVISTRPNANIITDLGVRVTVTMKTLDAASITGSGAINIKDANAGDVRFELPGSGTITATGKAESVNVSVDGSGNILCSDLQTKAATVTLRGTGNIAVYAAQSLDAALNGSGSIRYSGNPATVKTAVPGSGIINPVQ